MISATVVVIRKTTTNCLNKQHPCIMVKIFVRQNKWCHAFILRVPKNILPSSITAPPRVQLATKQCFTREHVPLATVRILVLDIARPISFHIDVQSRSAPVLINVGSFLLKNCHHSWFSASSGFAAAGRLLPTVERKSSKSNRDQFVRFRRKRSCQRALNATFKIILGDWNRLMGKWFLPI